MGDGEVRQPSVCLFVRVMFGVMRIRVRDTVALPLSSVNLLIVLCGGIDGIKVLLEMFHTK